MGRWLGVGWVLILLQTTAVVCAKGSLGSAAHHKGNQRWAILSTDAVENSGLSDLLAQFIIEVGDVQLVEREKIDAVVQELTIANILGPTAVKDRLRLGQLLRADGLLILSLDGTDGSRYVRLVICECDHGARLGQSVLEFAPAELARVAGAFRDDFAVVRSRYRNGIQRLIGVPPFVSKSLVHELDYLQYPLARVLEESLTAISGTAVLELEEARAISRELELAGESRSDAAMLFFVEGEFELTSITAAKNSDVHIRLRVIRGQGDIRVIEKTLDGVPQMVEYLRRMAVPELLELGADERSLQLTVEEQIERLESRAGSFELTGQCQTASELLEACLLLDSDRDDIALWLLDVLTRIVRGDQSSSSNASYFGEWRRRCTQWERAIEILSRLIRGGRVTRSVIIKADEDLAHAMGDLQQDLQSLGTYRGENDESPPFSAARREFARLSKVKRRFLDESYSLVWDLPARGRKAGWVRSDFKQWLSRMLSWRPFDPTGTQLTPMTYEDLNRHRWIVDKLAGKYGVYYSTKPLEFAVMAAFDLDFFRSFSNEDLWEFYETLACSNNPMSECSGRLGMILLSYYGQSEDKRPTASEILSMLEDLKGEIEEKLGLEFQLKEVGRTLAILAEREANAAMSLTEQPVADTPQFAPEAISLQELPNERIWFAVRSADRKSQLLSPLHWANQAGYIERSGAPVSILPVAEKELDIIWSHRVVWLHRSPGVLEPVYEADCAEISDVCWTGERIWMAKRGEGVTLLDMDTGGSVTISERNGLPPSERSLEIAPMQDGGVVVAGSFGPYHRGWIAVIDGESLQPRVVREGKELVGDRTFRNHFDVRDSPESKYAVFEPFDVVKCYDPNRPERDLYFVTRKASSGGSVFMVDPAADSVDLVPLCNAAIRLSGGWFYPDVVSLPGGRCLCKNKDMVFQVEALQHGAPPSEAALCLFWEEGTRLYKDMLEYDGYVYVPGMTWLRIDSKSMELELLGHGPLCEGWTRGRRHYGVSVHFGLLAWDSSGCFYSIQPPASLSTVSEKDGCARGNEIAEDVEGSSYAQSLAARDDGDLEVMELGKHIEDGLSLGHAVLVFHHDTGLWPQYLHDLVPKYIEKIPKGWFYRWTLDGYVHIEREISQQTREVNARRLAYVFNGYERGWYVFRDDYYARLKVEPRSWPVTPMTRDQLISNCVEELDRRIAREPDAIDHLRMKTWYLFKTGDLEGARKNAIAWAQLRPENTEPRSALCDIELKRVRNLDRDNPYINRDEAPFHSYAVWRLNNTPYFSTLQMDNQRIALELPFARNTAEWLIAEFCANEDAHHLLLAKKYGTLIALCNLWESSAANQVGLEIDLSYLAYRASAFLARGEFEEAARDVRHLDQSVNSGFIRCDYEDLRNAIENQNQRYHYECEMDRLSHVDWGARFNIDLPPDD